MKVEEAIPLIYECAKEVYAELGTGWNESIYQAAMEVALRHKGLMYETQRILPITFKGHVIGESIPDLVVWVEDEGVKTAIVIDLKADTGIKEDHDVQVRRYIQELRKQVRQNEAVYPKGYLINFVKESTSKKLEEGMYEDFDGVQILEVTS